MIQRNKYLISASSQFGISEALQGRIQTGSKGSHKPVKQFRFLKQSFKIYYQIPDYKKFRVSDVKLRKSLKKLNDSLLQHFLFPTA